MRCAVEGTEKNAMGHQKIHLTINPKDVNKGLNPTVLKAGMVSNSRFSSSYFSYLLNEQFLPNCLRQEKNTFLLNCKQKSDYK